jgi:hypothetical protein
LGGANELSGRYRSLDELRGLTFFLASTDIKDDKKHKEWRIFHPSTSELDRTLELARFELQTHALVFNWDENAVTQSRFQQLSRTLRDSVVRIETADRPRYVVLRGCPTRSTKPISLADNPKSRPAGYKPRSLATAWATEGSLDETSWTLCIRRWRIDVFPPKERQKVTFAEGDDNNLSAQVEKQVVPNAIDLKLKIDKHNLIIDLDFNEVKILDERKQWDALMKLQNDLAHKKGLEDIERKELEDIKKKLRDLKPKIDKYRQVDDNSGSELSIVIGLIVDDKTVIDLARIGSFADPAAPGARPGPP